MSFQIHFRETQASFQPADNLGKNDWLDTSYSQNKRAIGTLRMPVVHDGRYQSKHPVVDVEGNTVGFLVNGVSSIGYTFNCVYAGGCFWLTHQTFTAVTSSIDVSRISLVESSGSFFFSPTVQKFKVVKSFVFGGNWVDHVRAFKVLKNETYLLYLTNYGFCLFDIPNRAVIAKADFKDITHRWSGFAISPKAKLLAIGCSVGGDKDPLDGEYRSTNFVRIYDLETGVAVGEQVLSGDRQRQWAVEFSEDGRQIRAASDSSTQAFDLVATR